MNIPIKSSGGFGHHGPFHLPGKHQWYLFENATRALLKQSLKQVLFASTLAWALYFLLAQFSGRTEILAALAGVSSLLYLAVLVESSSLRRAVLTLSAIPLIFGFSYASLAGGGAFLVGAFLLHALVAVIQLSRQDKRRQAQLISWAAYNVCLALLLI